MSASEKLKALGVWQEQGWDSGPYDINERFRQDTLLDALPQIVAVVERAEVLALEMHDPGDPKHPGLVDALDALEEALT